jgi:NADPH:quinone reductase-like Zn-dependent oxidoreductase
VQLAATAGARVVASARNPDLWGGLVALGAEQVLAPEDAPGAGPFDVVLELVGGPGIARSLDALATGGRIAVIGVGAGASVELNLHVLMQRRGRIHGSTLRARPLEAKADAARRLEAHVLPHLGGRLHVPVAATYPLAEAPAAYERFEAGGKLGKIVLVP